MHVSEIIQILIIGIAIGGIPFGVLIAKLFSLPDPRYVGSGNIGATNMLRTGNKKAALLTLLLDAAKGGLVVALTYYLFHGSSDVCGTDTMTGITVCAEEIHPETSNNQALALAVLAAALGHMYSPWLKFKGGKGVATLLGSGLVFSWPVGMASLFVWLIVVFVKRYVSLGSVIALAIAPLVTWLRVDGQSALIIAVACALAIWKHRANIKRLHDGFEPKLNFGKGNKNDR